MVSDEHFQKFDGEPIVPQQYLSRMDKLVFPDVDLTVYRFVVALVGLLILLPGLILERE